MNEKEIKEIVEQVKEAIKEDSSKERLEVERTNVEERIVQLTEDESLSESTRDFHVSSLEMQLANLSVVASEKERGERVNEALQKFTEEKKIKFVLISVNDGNNNIEVRVPEEDFVHFDNLLAAAAKYNLEVKDLIESTK